VAGSLAPMGRRPCAHGRAVSQSALHEPTGLGWHAVGVPIDVALLGCGHPHVPDVLGVLASERDLRLVAAWDPDPSAIPFAVSGAAVKRVESAIGRAHAVVICAPTDQRPALCVQAARAGRPILVEQPVARSAAEARAVAHQIGRSRTPALAALFLRELPALGRLGGVLRERLVGRVASASASLTHPGAIDGWFEGPCAWIRDPRRAGVGGFGDLALHLVDALAALGADEPPRLAAVALDRDAPGAGDLGGVAVGSWAGAPLIVRASWATRPGGLELVVHGAAGTATVRDGVLELRHNAGDAERWVGAPPDAGEALRAFATRLRARRFPRDGLAPAIRAQERIEAAVPVASEQRHGRAVRERSRGGSAFMR
jgi:predicted dehydrogenase